MQLTLVVQTGDSSGKRFVANGPSLRVGRVAPVDVCVLDDPMLSASHFCIETLDDNFVLRDLKSRFGTQVNGAAVTETPLQDGDTITAGRTSFRVELIGGTVVSRTTVADPTPMPRGPAPESIGSSAGDKAFVLQFLRTLQNLHAVLDAARNPAILELVKSSGLVHESLYDGEKGKEIEAFGPWLVELPPGAELLESLVDEGWGDSWGVYLTSPVPFADIRRQLRRHLLVKLPDGREVYFRYYDPRVIPTYLQTCTPDELASFFGPIRRVITESADAGNVLEFAPKHKDWRKLGLGAAGIVPT
jgi:pSer/pThr/pTyr-binding forkhead associated (FHA) protein